MLECTDYTTEGVYVSHSRADAAVPSRVAVMMTRDRTCRQEAREDLPPGPRPKPGLQLVSTQHSALTAKCDGDATRWEALWPHVRTCSSSIPSFSDSSSSAAPAEENGSVVASVRNCFAASIVTLWGNGSYSTIVVVHFWRVDFSDMTITLLLWLVRNLLQIISILYSLCFK